MREFDDEVAKLKKRYFRFERFLRDREPLVVLLAFLALGFTLYQLNLYRLDLQAQRQERREERAVREASLFVMLLQQLDAVRRKDSGLSQRAPVRHLGLVRTCEKVVDLNISLNMIDFSSVSLREADLPNAQLSEAILNDTVLAGANLINADLTRAQLLGADLTEANLTGANLQQTDLRGANLSGATLQGVNFTGALLEGTNLTEANLRTANVSQGQLDSACILPQASIELPIHLNPPPNECN